MGSIKADPRADGCHEEFGADEESREKATYISKVNSGVETLKLTSSTVIKCLRDAGRDLGNWTRQEWGGEEFNIWSPGGVEAIFTLRNFPPLHVLG